MNSSVDSYVAAETAVGKAQTVALCCLATLSTRSRASKWLGNPADINLGRWNWLLMLRALLHMFDQAVIPLFCYQENAQPDSRAQYSTVILL